MLPLSHINKKISKAEILLKESEIMIPGENKVCEIRLTVYGDDLLVRSRTENFEKSSKEVIKELRKLVNEQVKKQKEPPDKRTSTVTV